MEDGFSLLQDFYKDSTFHLKQVAGCVEVLQR
jgi:hypothetical protein